MHLRDEDISARTPFFETQFESQQEELDVSDKAPRVPMLTVVFNPGIHFEDRLRAVAIIVFVSTDSVAYIAKEDL